MQGNVQVIIALNHVLATKLTAINQLYLHGRMGINWGFKRLGSKITKQSIEVMKHASTLTDRILLLEGLPNLQKLNPLTIGEDVEEQLQNDLQMAKNDVVVLRDAIALCTNLGDHGSREMLDKILVDDEEFLDWLEEQGELLVAVGKSNYLATQVEE
jgi:bacterioferritin